MYVLLNGEVLSNEAATISPFDRGFLLGDGVFTTLLAKEGHLECFEAHLKRLKQATKTFSLPEPSTGLQNQILKLLESNYLTKELAAVRITITRGIGGRGISPPETPSPTTLITATPYKKPTSPLKVMISSIKREKTYPLCQIKHLGYQASILAKLEALKREFEDALMFNASGNLVCSTAGNLFLIQHGIITTPPITDGTIPGIMRAKILQHNKNIKIQSLTIKDLENAEAAFITNSLIGMQMISNVEGKSLKTNLNFSILTEC
ncbi:MAG: aminotransferase class IV [Alphaproteobacteria bacterium]|nr:aminotransferase class IV [Alphaproteobacteria bacterium]